MIRRGAGDLKQGDIAALDIYDHKGSILVKKETAITGPVMEKFRRYDIPFIYVPHEKIRVSHVFEQATVAEVLKVLYYFIETKGENSTILKRYNREEINRFLSYNNETGNKIAYGHIFGYFASELVRQARKRQGEVYDFRDYRNRYTYMNYHLINSASISIIIAVDMGLDDKDIECLATGALLYDISMKLYNFVNNRAELDETEKEEMQQHTYMSFDSIRKIYGIPAKAASIAFQHHERLDGSGYPKKLKGDDIGLLSRIVSVADVYDALVSSRPFRKAYTSDEAWDYIVSNSGILFDRGAVDSFKRVIPKFMPGDRVLLSDGREAVIACNYYGKPAGPDIIIIEKKVKNDIIPVAEISAEKENIAILKTIL